MRLSLLPSSSSQSPCLVRADFADRESGIIDLDYVLGVSDGGSDDDDDEEDRGEVQRDRVHVGELRLLDVNVLAVLVQRVDDEVLGAAHLDFRRGVCERTN